MTYSQLPLHKLGLQEQELILFGKDKAKIPLELLQKQPKGRLVLVSAITPTPAGEGKTTTTIGLSDALSRSGAQVCAALREPSLGPCMGIKGGGTGGGKSVMVPESDINLHFNGDFHAITAAHNLIAAILDNHIYFKSGGIHPHHVAWPRVLDMNDRSLRKILVGLGGAARESHFDITAASEIMAILCLARDPDDLKKRLENTLVAWTPEGAPITIKDLQIADALMTLLEGALAPNLVQTAQGTPAIVHGGPFANIAHGCNSVIATSAAMQLADWTVTEAGFGFDLGGEKFMHIKTRSAGLEVSAVVLVATIRALKMHGGQDLKQLDQPDPGAVERGLGNLQQHCAAAQAFGYQPIIALNHFESDQEDEIRVLEGFCRSNNLRVARCQHFQKGGEGALELAQHLMDQVAEQDSAKQPSYQYQLDQSFPQKTAALVKNIYGGREAIWSPKAKRKAQQFTALGYGNLPLCMAKTQNSLSDDPKKPGRPTDFTIHIRDLELNAGAGFVVALTGDMLRMPGLPRRPRALDSDAG